MYSPLEPSQSKQVDTSIYHKYMKIFKICKYLLAQVLDQSPQLTLTGSRTVNPKEPLGSKKDSHLCSNLTFPFKSCEFPRNISELYYHINLHSYCSGHYFLCPWNLLSVLQRTFGNSARSNLEPTSAAKLRHV